MRPRWYFEVVPLIGGYVLFGLIRAAIDRGDPAATDNAHLIQRLERVLHLAVEPPVNHAMLGHPFAMDATGYFYRLSVLAVPAVLIWLYIKRPEHYRLLRTVLVVMTLMDLPLVWLFPVAPPRLALAGVVDYMEAARHTSTAVNVHGAMPSMHIAWTTWCAYAVWTATRPAKWAWPAWLFPMAVAFVVLATGHHYVLDVVAGSALAGLVALTARWRRRAKSAGRSMWGLWPTPSKTTSS